MLIRVGFEAAFDFEQASSVLLLPYVHPSLSHRIRTLDQLLVTPHVPVAHYLDLYGNRGARTSVPAGRVAFQLNALVEDDGRPEAQASGARQHPIHELPDDVLHFLLASRYCEVDSELRDIAWSLFGHLPAGWPLVQAICDFVHRHIHFDYLAARATRTALESFRERIGVCRDYMHLAVTFCRCLNVPARYCTGYLGDIGVPASSQPMDFSAWFEVYLGGNWHPFDARNNTPRIGRILMARGRDAADVALTTSFGKNQLRSFRVWTDEVSS